MKRKWNYLGLIAATTAAISACASQPSLPPMETPPSADPPPQAEFVPAAEPTLPPLAVDGIVIPDLVKMLRNNPFTHYHVANNSYSFYVGTLIYAEYEATAKRLVVRADANDENSPKCTIEMSSAPAKDAAASEVCRQLLPALKNDLQDHASN